MNALAHHFVISMLNECIKISTEVHPDEPHLTIADAVVRLYLGYQQIEKLYDKDKLDEYMKAEVECRMEDAAQALQYYASNTGTHRLIKTTYEILENFDANAKAWARQHERSRAKTVVIDNRTTTNGEPS